MNDDCSLEMSVSGQGPLFLYNSDEGDDMSKTEVTRSLIEQIEENITANERIIAETTQRNEKLKKLRDSLRAGQFKSKEVLSAPENITEKIDRLTRMVGELSARPSIQSIVH